MIREQLSKFSGMIASYKDDTFMIIFSDTVDEHLTHIIASPSKHRHFGLYVTSSQCEWLQTRVFVPALSNH
jgi:hypothetical protein